MLNFLVDENSNANFGDIYIEPPVIWTTQITKEAIENDLLLSVRAPVGAVNICTCTICIGRGLMAIRSKENVNNKYLFYILKSLRDEFKKLSMGSTFEAVTKKDVEDFLIPLPSLDAQQKIADELEMYQEMICSAKNIINKYKPIIPKNIDAKLEALESIVVFRPSKDEIKHLAEDTLVSFVPMADMNSHNIYFTPKEEKPLKDVLSGFTYFKDNDVLLAKITPCFENGKAGVAHNLKNGVGFGSTEYIVMRANTDIVYPEWIYYCINSREFLSQGKGFMKGTAGQQRLDMNFIKNCSILVPSLAEQRRILDSIQAEKALIEPSKQIIEVFTKKIYDRVAAIWGDK